MDTPSARFTPAELLLLIEPIRFISRAQNIPILRTGDFRSGREPVVAENYCRLDNQLEESALINSE